MSNKMTIKDKFNTYLKHPGSFVVFLQALLLWEELSPKIPEYDCQEWVVGLPEKQTASLWERL